MVPVPVGDRDVRALGQRDPDEEDARRRGTAQLRGRAAGGAGDLRGGRGAGPLHLDLGDHHRLLVSHPVRNPQPALACRTPRGVGRQTQATARRSARGPPGATEPPADIAARAAQAERTVDGAARTAQAGRSGAMTQPGTRPGTHPVAPPGSAAGQLTLTARLNTSAVDSRRGVIRLHPNAVAALGIREWDAVTLTGSRTTAAVAGMARPQTPIGTVLLDDVTLSNAGLSEDTAVIVAAATVYGARSVTLSGSTLASQSVPSTTLRQALLGKVLTVGDAVSLLPRDLGPGTSTSAATRALASAVGISWTSELLTVTGVDPTGPVSVQPNSLVTWGNGVAVGDGAPQPEQVEAKALQLTVSDLKGVSAQAAKLTEWLKLALDEPHLLHTLGATTNLGVL